MLFARREVRIEKNCARGLAQDIDRGQNFSQCGPPGRQITFLFFLFIFTETFVGFACHELAVICWRARW